MFKNAIKLENSFSQIWLNDELNDELNDVLTLQETQIR